VSVGAAVSVDARRGIRRRAVGVLGGARALTAERTAAAAQICLIVCTALEL